jgi:hypothetical protein
MQATEIDKFNALLLAIGEYYNREISAPLAQIYWEGLKRYDYPAISRAAQMHMANPDAGQFFPKIADFVRHISGGNADRALVAWAKVDKAVRTVGDHRSVVFDDPIIHSVIVDMGGWVGFGMCEMDEWPFRQNEFVKRYRGYLERGDIGEYPAKLSGRHDAYNRQIGNEGDSETALIGDYSKAMEVLNTGSDSGKKNPVVLLSDHAHKRSGSFKLLGIG